MTIYYSAEHEWVRVDNNTATVGISNFAQEQLGDIVFVELPEVGAELASKDSAAVVESVKAASDIYSPISGSVTAVNDSLTETPELVNQDPEGEGWFFQIALSDKSQLDSLMSAADYQKFCDE